MGWLAGLLGATFIEGPTGVRLDMSKPFWELEGGTDFPHLLRAMGDLHVYRNSEVLPEWHDAFAQPMLLSSTLPKSKIRAFAKALGMTATLHSQQ